MITNTITITAVDRLLEAFSAGAGGTVAELYTDDARFDATVPDWRFQLRGGEAIASQYAGWFAHEGRFDELDRWPINGGEVVVYLLTWIEDGVPHAAHHSHVLMIGDDGRITGDMCFCGGRWNATRLAEMAEASHAS